MNRRLPPALPLLILVLLGCTPPVSENLLAERIAASKPAWQSYQEDVKSQIGAGPIAQWQGQPVRAVHQGSLVRLTFALSGPWAERDMAVPVLLRDPLGEPHQNTAARREGAEVTYEFAVPDSDTAYAWVEIKFPNGARRIALKQDGSWEQSA